MIGAQPFYPRNYARRVWQRNPERTFRELCLGPGAALAELRNTSVIESPAATTNFRGISPATTKGKGPREEENTCVQWKV